MKSTYSGDIKNDMKSTIQNLFEFNFRHLKFKYSPLTFLAYRKHAIHALRWFYTFEK